MPGKSYPDEDQPTLDELISLSQAAELSGLSPRHLRHLAIQGEIWSRKLGRNWFTTVQAVMNYVAQEHKPGPKPHLNTGISSEEG